jgi:predicted AAA+ superfamily ATPase
LAGKDPGFLDRIFHGNFKMEKHQRLGRELVARVAAGGYPGALERDDGRRRRLWYKGQVLETFVLQELKRLSSWHSEPLAFHHFRDKEGNEVDIVMERADGTCAGVEVKSSATIRPEDFKGLKMLRDGAGRRFAAGVILHDGETSLRFEENLFSVPISALWGKTKG